MRADEAPSMVCHWLLRRAMVVAVRSRYQIPQVPAGNLFFPTRLVGLVETTRVEDWRLLRLFMADLC